MTTLTTGRWLLVALAVVAVALAPAVVSAHGNETTAGTPPYNGTAADWAAWMEAHMAEHMGPGAVEWMEAHMGVTVDDMAEDMADGDYDNHGHGTYGPGYGHGMYGPGYGGMYDQGYGC